MPVLMNNSLKPAAELLDYLEQRGAGIDLQGVSLFSDRLDRHIAAGLSSAFEVQTESSKDTDEDLEFLVQSASDRLLSAVFNKPGFFP